MSATIKIIKYTVVFREEHSYAKWIKYYSKKYQKFTVRSAVAEQCYSISPISVLCRKIITASWGEILMSTHVLTVSEETLNSCCFKLKQEFDWHDAIRETCLHPFSLCVTYKELSRNILCICYYVLLGRRKLHF